jgi:NhaP-type Na+/H+ or K+/H+ antiporter
VLAGVIMAARIEEFITLKDFMKNMALYFILHIIRFCVIMTLSPYMNMMDYKLDFNSIVFASYAGMRGAVALCLALLLTENAKVPKSVSMLVLFHVCGTVVWTLVINGMTAAWLLNALGL